MSKKCYFDNKLGVKIHCYEVTVDFDEDCVCSCGEKHIPRSDTPASPTYSHNQKQRQAK